MLNPCGHRIVVKRDSVEETYGDSGIIVTASESAKKLEVANCQTGVVVAIGPDAWKAFRMRDENGREVNGRPWAHPGDYVIFAKYAGRNIDDPFTKGEEDFIILNDEDVIAIITPSRTEIPACSAKEATEA